METRHVMFSGRVQGVGFRYTCRQTAQGLGLGGWVRNLPDGRVEAVIQGPADALTEFVRQVSETTHGRVDDVQTTRLAAEGDLEYQGFEIRV